jgi:hypothetical protein
MTHVTVDGDWALWPVAAVRGAGMPFDWLAGLSGPDDVATLRELLREPLFLAALVWQNPGMVRNWAAQPTATITPIRARSLARYAQRYCAKNDSIGFFGPVGWAELVDDPGDRLVVTGSGGTRRCDVSFEHWAISAVARTWEADERVRPHLPVRLNPAVHDDGTQLHRPYRPALARDTSTAELLRVGVLRAGWLVQPGTHPQHALRVQVAALPDPAVRADLLSELDGLDGALAEAAKVSDQPAELNEALAALDERFTTVTGNSAVRGKPEAAAGRTLAYLDCRRDLDVRVPAGLVAGLAAPLALLLRSARWFTAQVAEAAEEHFERSYAALRRSRDEVRLSDLHLASADLLSGGPGTPIHEISKDFQLRWTEVLRGSTGVVSSADIEPLVAALFHATGPGWAAARHHSPDVMLSLTDQGPRWVLGELHLAMNTLDQQFFHTVCDDPERLVALTECDMAGGRIVPCYPLGPEIDSRRYPPLAVHLPDRYLYWSYSDDMGAPEGAPSVPATGLVVRRGGDGLAAGPRGGWSVPVREFFGEFLSALVVNRFRLPAPGPRLAIDDLVIRRATWHFPAADLPAGTVARSGYRPDALSRWLADRGLPRHLFARVPGETKPFYVDLAAPLTVGNLARYWRRATDGTVELQEMLPDPDELWLRDPDGRRYTSEFRMVAVDAAARRLPSLESLPTQERRS